MIGIIAEYNPFHQGHLQQIQWVKEHFPNEPLIIAMSGDFVQRGEPAIFSKEARAKAAITFGADLVVQLPTLFSIQSAELFAKGGVMTLGLLGVKRLVYGTLQPELTYTPHREETIQQSMKSGDSYAKAIEKSMDMGYLDANTRLGFAYQKAIRNLRLPMEVVPMLRSPWATLQVPLEEQNATSIRCKIKNGEDPVGIQMPLESTYTMDLAVLLYYLLRFTDKDFLTYPYAEPGLRERLLQTYDEGISFEVWIKKARSRRHTKARIRRFCLHVLFDVQKDTVKQYSELPMDAVIPLAWNENGQKILRECKNEVRILSTQKQIDRYLHKNESVYFLEKKAAALYEFLKTL